MVRRLSILVAVFPLLAAGPSAPTPQAAVGQMVETLVIAQQLTLVDPGSTPRVVLRYTPEPGAIVTYETVSRTGLDLSMTLPDGSPMALPLGELLPEVVTTTRNTVGPRGADGQVVVRTEQLGARVTGNVAPEVAAAVRQGLDGATGLVLETTVSSDGRPVRIDVVGGRDPGTTALVRQIAEQTLDRLMLFPPEPVGPGARWTSDIDLTVSGLALIVSQTVTAKKVTPEAVDLDVVLDVRLGSGGLVVPGLPPGTPPPKITRFSGTGGGATRVDLATLVSTGTIAMTIDADLQTALPGIPGMALTMKIGQVTETRLAKPAPELTKPAAR